MKNLTFNDVSGTVRNAVSTLIHNDVYDNWCDILCNNCLGYSHCFVAYNYDGSEQVQGHDIDEIIHNVYEAGWEGIILLNGCITSLDEMRKLWIYIADESAEWHKDTVVEDYEEYIDTHNWRDIRSEAYDEDAVMEEREELLNINDLPF